MDHGIFDVELGLAVVAPTQRLLGDVVGTAAHVLGRLWGSRDRPLASGRVESILSGFD